MSACTQTGKPLISIVMAVYEPNERWLWEQLISLNNQTYPNLELRILDDCSPAFQFKKLKELAHKCVTKFHCIVDRNEKNLGSDKTFEKLTMQAKGKYIAYCDQDDIWIRDKLSEEMKCLEDENASLVCSDMFLIDKRGAVISTSIRQKRKRHVFYEGNHLAPLLLVKNFVVGCTMLLPTEIARSAVPFAPYFVHDQWLAVIAALNGRISVIRKPLIQYRQHELNQTGILSGITTKRDYTEKRVALMCSRFLALSKRKDIAQSIGAEVQQLLNWSQARLRYAHYPNKEDLSVMWKFRKYAKTAILLETLLPFLPEKLFYVLVYGARRGIF